MDASAASHSILFYCRDCKTIVDNPERVGGKYEYRCPDCKGDRVAFGSQKSICDFFQVTPPKKNA